MITYKGTPMLSRRDWIDNADKLDPEFADALDEYLCDYEAVCDENDYLIDENNKYENEVEQLERQIEHFESLKIGVVMKQNEELLANMKEIYQMLSNCKGVESIMKARLKKALEFMKEKGVA